MNHLKVETEDSFSSVLELAANNDVDGFKVSIDRDPLAIDEVGDWYGRKKVVEHRTPLMVAATYGSLDVLKFILRLSSADVNRCCGQDKATALHCAASGGSANAFEAVKILLSAGADPHRVDANGHRPADMIVVPPKASNVKASLEELLGSSGTALLENLPEAVRVSARTFNVNHPSPPSSPEEGGSPIYDSTSSPITGLFLDLPQSLVPEKKEYLVDPSLPDIKNSIYATDEFRMFSFKVRPCSRAYSHDWTECPFVHPGENARRRDPRKYHYSCVPCPEFRKGACRRGDMCEYAHGVFECWLHPAQYRTRLCKDGTSCSRRVCFFAHTSDELRPLYMSTGSAVPSPRSSSSAAVELAAIGLMPSSPSAPAVNSPFTPPMSPSANGMNHTSSNWPQSNLPTMHLTGINLQSSRLRSSLSARDMQVDDYSMMQDFGAHHLMNDLSISRLGPSVGNRTAHPKILNPSNLDDLFSSEISSSPRYNEQGVLFSPSRKSAILHQFQQQHQALLSPVNLYSPKPVDHLLPGHSHMDASPGFSSSGTGMMSPRRVDQLNPMLSHMSAFDQQENQQNQTSRSLSSRELGAGLSGTVGSLGASSSKWASPSGTLDWGVNDVDEVGQLRRSFELRSGCEEPDVSWVHSLVKESPPEKPVTTAKLP